EAPPLNRPFCTWTPSASSTEASFRTTAPEGSCPDPGSPARADLIGTIARSRNPAIPEMPFLRNKSRSSAIPVPEDRGFGSFRDDSGMTARDLELTVQREVSLRGAFSPSALGRHPNLQIEYQKLVVFQDTPTILAEIRG